MPNIIYATSGPALRAAAAIAKGAPVGVNSAGAVSAVGGE